MRCRAVAAFAFASLIVGCQPRPLTLGGTVTGLAGTGLVLQNLGADNLTINKDGGFVFSDTFTKSTPYYITVLTQPSSPTQTCAIPEPVGTAGVANVTNIQVVCTTNTYAISGAVSGLSGTGLVLEDNGRDPLTVLSNGTFSFPTALASGAAYAVTVEASPAGPSQDCVVTGGAGTVGSAAVTDVLVTCTDSPFTIGGTITGLVGSGLVLEDNGGDDLAVTAGASAGGATTFAFATPIGSSGTYNVTISAQPTDPAQSCAVTSGTGAVGAANVTSIVIDCATNAYTVGGIVTGLAGTGLVLQDNDGDNLPITGNGLFSFATEITSGDNFVVTVGTQPSGPTQTCTVSGGTGQVGGAAVTSVTVSCATNTYALSGTVTGLIGTGLVLQDNGGDNVTVTPGSPMFAFPTPLGSGATYAISVATQPTMPTQSCVVSTDASGAIVSAAVTDIAVTCTTNGYPVSVNVIGLAGSGLVLKDNTADSLTIAANGLATFPSPVPSGGTYAVTVGTQPSTPTQVCTIASPTGAISAAGVTVTVNCATTQFTVGVTVSGLGSSPVVLQDNGGDNLTVATNTSQSFATALASGSSYAVSVLTQPTGLTCSVSAPTGTVTTANIALNVVCSANAYAVGGTVTGLQGTGLVLVNGTDTLDVMGNGTFALPSVASGGTYNVQVQTQPTAPTQTCSVATGTGTLVASDVTSVVVTCSTDAYAVSVAVFGLAGTGLTLQDNGADNLTITADGTSQFVVPIASGGSYSVIVTSQPPGETCTVTPPTGVIVSAPTTLQVSCSTNSYSVGGTVTGLLGSGLVLSDGSDTLPVTGDGTFVVDSLASGSNYDVEVVSPPTGPSQTCTLSSNMGTVTTSNVTNVLVTCVTNDYPINVTVNGLSGSGLVVQDSVGDELTFNAAGTAPFTTSFADGSIFTVDVVTQPTGPSQTCRVQSSGGLIMGGPATVVVACTTNSYSIGGTVTGLAGSGLVLANGAATVNVTANGPFVLPAVASGAGYAVSVATQPSSPQQTCTVTNPSTTVGAGNVTGVVVACVTKTFPISVNVTGLAGTGLVFQDNGGDNLPVTGNGITPFATQIASGATYAVSVLTQPSALAQTCAITAGSGSVTTAPVTIAVKCTTSTFSVGGFVTGLAGTGLVLLNDGGSNLSITANGAFSFPSIASGAAYLISTFTQPSSPTQTCTVSSAGGNVAGANVTNVAVNCVTNTYPLSVNVTGLTGTLQLMNNGTNPLSVTNNGTTPFTGTTASGAGYDVTVASAPAGQSCVVTAPVGTITTAAVTLTVTCTTSTFTVGGTISGLTGTGLVLQNGTTTLPVSGTSFTFPALPSGSNYNIAVATPPSAPTQVCAVTSGVGTLTTANVTGVQVTCTTSTFTVSASVTGLSGSGFVLEDNGNDNLPITGNGLFNFAKPVASSGTYSVTVLDQPTAPAQTCTVTSPMGAVTNANVTVNVSCGTSTYTFGGTVTGLSGTGLVLKSGTTTLPIASNGAFAFPAVASGTTYAVTASTQPASPTQTCTVTAGSGTVTNAPVTSILVSCATTTFAVSAKVTGLAGASPGLILEDEVGETLTFNTNTTQAFATQVASGATYVVSVATQPASPTQTCVVAAPTGLISTAAVTVNVTCTTNTYTFGGSVTGLAGTGLVLANGATTQAVTANGQFSFPAVASGTAYTVTVGTAPGTPTQTCTVSNGTGTMAASNVTNILVACTTTTYAVSVSVTGLASGASVVLQDNGGDNLTFTSNTTGAFATHIASGSTYAVSVLTEPSSPMQICIPQSPTGTIGTISPTVAVNCLTLTYSYGGVVTGLAGSGLVLISGTFTNPVEINGPFIFPPIASGTAYTVTVATQPSSPTQTCTVASGTGTITNGNLTNIVVTCTTTTYAVSAAVSGLATGDSVVLQDNGGNNLTVSSNATVPFTTALASGSAYAVSVLTQPSNPTQVCTVASPSGTVTTAAVTVSVTCSTPSFTYGGVVAGLTGSGLVLANGTTTLPVSAAGTFTFPSVPSGTAYAVTVKTQPSSPTQTCIPSANTGSVTNAAVTSIVVACTTTTYTVSAAVTGLVGTGLVLQDNAGSNLSVTSNTAFSFGTPIASGAVYSVSVLSQPTSPVQTCIVAAPTGTVTTANVTVNVTCTTNAYTIGGNVTGVSGSGLVLLDNGGNALPIGASGPFTFTTPIASNVAYAVTVGTEPSLPTQTCTPSTATGTVAGANVTNVAIACTTNNYAVSAVVTGLVAGATLKLQDNGGNTQTVTSASPTASFGSVASGSAYAITVSTQPALPLLQECTVTSGSGIVGSASVTVNVACIGPPSAATSTLISDPSVVRADGISVAAMTLTVKDSSGNLLPNQPVTLTTKLSTGTQAQVQLAPMAGTTNDRGVFTTRMTSVHAGAVTVAPTAADIALNPEAITFAAQPGTDFELEQAPLAALTTGVGPAQITTADFNRDGFPDMAITNNGSGTVSIFKGNGTGNFTPFAGSPMAVGKNSSSGPDGILVVDLNLDGILDLAIADNEGTVTLLKGNGDGTFTAFASSPVTAGVESEKIGTADFNRDGVPDLVVQSNGGGYATVMLGAVAPATGQWSVASSKNYSTAANPTGVVVADFNQDGYPDFAVCSYSPAVVTVYLGSGGTTFVAAPGSPFAVGAGPEEIAVGEFNSDVWPDLVVASSGATVSILMNTGTGAGTFAAYTTTPSISDLFSIRVADINRDGFADLVMGGQAAGASLGAVGVLLGTGLGTFNAAPSFNVGYQMSGIGLADVNNDGRLDLIALNSTASMTSANVNLGDGEGGFPKTTVYVKEPAPPASPQPVSVAFGDFNEDGRLDVAVSDTGGTVGIWLNGASGALTFESFFTGGLGAPLPVMAGDFNNDGHLDLAVGNSGGSVSILLGTGTGSFTAASGSPFYVGGAGYAIAIGDFNGDGNLDAATTDFSGSAWVGLGTGTGAIGTGAGFATNATGQVWGMTAADLNGDGKLDLAIPTLSANVVSVLIGTGSGTFAAGVTTAVGGSPYSVTAADFNADGYIDLAVSNSGSAFVSVLTNKPAAPGTFTSATYPAPAGGLSLVGGDLNGDGHADIAIAYPNNTISVLLGTGTSFGSVLSYTTGTGGGAAEWGQGLALGDLDGNGSLDLAYVDDNGAQTLTEVLNECFVSPP